MEFDFCKVLFVTGMMFELPRDNNLFGIAYMNNQKKIFDFDTDDKKSLNVLV